MIHTTSDLHYGISPQGDSAVRSLALELSSARENDVLLIGGDIAVDDEGVRDCLELFRDYPGRKLAIPGNHDVWVGPGGDSFERYRRLSDIFSKAGFHPLHEEPVVINGIGFAGTMGWYDRSFKDEIGIPESAYETKTFPEGRGLMWGDAAHVHWSYQDEDLARLLAERLATQLDQLRHAREVVVLTHHVPTKRLLFQPRWLVPRQWRFLNTFLGSERYAEVIGTYANVRQVICGHIHRSNSVEVHGKTYTSIGSDYGAKMLLTYDGEHIRHRTIRGAQQSA